MRERAALIGAKLKIGANPAGSGLRGPARHPSERHAMTPLKTRILLADDHAVVRHGLRMVLDSEPDLEVVAEAGDGAEAVKRALPRGHRPRDPRHRDAADDRAAGRSRASPPAPAAADPDPLDAPERAVPLRGAQGRRLRIRAEDGRRSRSGRGLPGRDARRAVPVPGRDDAADPGLPAPRAQRRGPARGSAHRARAGGRQADRRGLQQRSRSPRRS